ncbi:MAG: DUF1622 domain-containing protein [Actinomycetota bacterium]
MALYHSVLDALRLVLLLIGSIIVFAGIGQALLRARGPGGRSRAASSITAHAALGLEFFVGATILNLVVRPSWTSVATTAVTIAVRKLLTLSLGLAHGGPSPRRERG